MLSGVFVPLAVLVLGMGSLAVAQFPEWEDEEIGPCRFTQDCIQSQMDDPNCHPRAVFPNESWPQPFDGQFDMVCQQYQDSACCSHQQRAALFLNFQLIQASFGGPGGCPACAENVQNFWCNYVCSPNQTFVEILGVKEVPDPENAPNIATVLEVNVLVDKASACSLFASCADTTYVHEDAALGDCQGFLRFQGQTEALGHGNDINFIFTNSSTPPNAPRMFLDNLSCANYTLPGANTSAACDCSVCSAACTAADVVPVKVKVLQGFGTLTVVVFSVVVVVLSIAATQCRRRYNHLYAGDYY